MQLSPAERERRSQQAKRQHREGSLGSTAIAKRAGERSAEVRTARASSIARRLLEEHEEEVRKTLLEVLKNGTRSEKLKAVDLMTKAGLRGEGAQLNEHKVEAEHLDRQELIDLLARKLTTGPTAGLIRARIVEQHNGIVDGTAVQIAP